MAAPGFFLGSSEMASDAQPRDKAKVEGAVLIVERWILARLRHRRFFSLADLAAAIAALLEDLKQPADAPHWKAGCSINAALRKHFELALTEPSAVTRHAIE
jgi:transposase